MLSRGNLIDLVALATAERLKIHDDGSVTARPGRDVEGVFTVTSRDDSEVFSLQSYHFPNFWLAIKDGYVTHVKDTAGHCCDFKVSESAGFHVTLESMEYPGTFICVLPNGDVKPTVRNTNCHFRVGTVFVEDSQ
jgi:hypothetical protein